MQVEVEMHNGDRYSYAEAERVEDKDKYQVCIYGENRKVLAILQRGDIKSLITKEG